MKILSIDAWADGESGWNWNNWFHVGDISREDYEALTDDASKIAWMVAEGFLKDGVTVATCRVEDDQYNDVFCDAEDGQPCFAIEYGAEY